MDKNSFFAITQRSCRALQAVVCDPEAPSFDQSGAWGLLRWFPPDGGFIPQLERLCLDTRRETSFRESALGLLCRWRQPQDETLVSLLKEGTAGLSPTLLMAACHGRSIEVADYAAQFSPAEAAAALSTPRGSSRRLPLGGPVRTLLYARARPELGLALARHTLDFEQSRVLLQREVRSSVEELSRYDLPESFLLWLNEREPALMQAALHDFVLPAKAMLLFWDQQEAQRHAAVFLRRSSDTASSPSTRARRRRTQNAPDILRLSGPNALDALLRDVDLPETTYSLVATARLGLSPAPDFDAFDTQLLMRASFDSVDLARWQLGQPEFEAVQSALRTVLRHEPGWNGAAAFLTSEDPMIRLLALGAESAKGDSQATSSLMVVAETIDAPLLARAQAVRSLREAKKKPKRWAERLLHLLADTTTYENYYQPLRSESAMAFSRGFGVDPALALPALIQAGIESRCSESDIAIHYAVRSWFGRQNDICPVWYENPALPMWRQARRASV